MTVTSDNNCDNKHFVSCC